MNMSHIITQVYKTLCSVLLVALVFSAAGIRNSDVALAQGEGTKTISFSQALSPARTTSPTTPTAIQPLMETEVLAPTGTVAHTSVPNRLLEQGEKIEPEASVNASSGIGVLTG